MPFISRALGIILNIALVNVGTDLRELILNGIITGLSAVGLYSTSKNLVEKKYNVLDKKALGLISKGIFYLGHCHNLHGYWGFSYWTSIW